MNELTTTEKPKAPLPMGSKGVELESFEALWRFAQCVSASPFAPRGMEKPEAIVAAIQLGLEIGLTPMSALQNVAVINGRPGIYGDAALALVRGSGRCEQYSQVIEGEGDKRAATVISKRDDSEDPITTTFSVADAKKAGLWGKQGPWTQYPDRMLLFRARGFNLRDNFGDILKGLSTLEELRDHEIKKIEARIVSDPIKFGPAEVEREFEPATREEMETEAARAQSDAQTPPLPQRRKRRTKASAEPKTQENGVSGADLEGNQPQPSTKTEKSVSADAPPRATPLQGLRNLIAASPLEEKQLVHHLVAKMALEPHQNLENISEEKVIAITQEFMVLASEILDGAKSEEEEPLPF